MSYTSRILVCRVEIKPKGELYHLSYVFGFRHQRLYSLLDRFRLSTVQDSPSPSPPVTSHPLDGDGHMALEAVSPDKVSVQHPCVILGLAWSSWLLCPLRLMQTA